MSTTEKNIKGTQTEKNLVISYFAESTAYTRYMFYARQANKEKLYPVERVFEVTAANEKRHSKIFFKYLEGGKVEVPMTADAGTIGTTADNLKIAISEEKAEGFEFYRAAAKTAQAEGFDDIAAHFLAIADIEEHHYNRFKLYLKRIEEGTLWKRDTPIRWQCLICGYVYEGTTPPQECPACNHPMEYYVPLDEEVDAIDE